MFITFGICWSTVFSSAVFVLPRLLRVRANQNTPNVTRSVAVSGVSYPLQANGHSNINGNIESLTKEEERESQKQSDEWSENK